MPVHVHHAYYIQEINDALDYWWTPYPKAVDIFSSYFSFPSDDDCEIWPRGKIKLAFYDSWLVFHQNHLLIPSQICLISWYTCTLPYTWVYSIGWAGRFLRYWPSHHKRLAVDGHISYHWEITSVNFGNKSRKMWALVPSQIEPGRTGSITRNLTDECCT